MTIGVPKLKNLNSPPLPNCAPSSHHPTLLPPNPFAFNPGRLNFQLGSHLLLFTVINNTSAEYKEDLKLCLQEKSGRCSAEMNYHICSFFCLEIYLPSLLSQVQHTTIHTDSLPEPRHAMFIFSFKFMSTSLELWFLLYVPAIDRQNH